MEPTTMAYLTVIIGGISLQSPEPVTLEQCAVFQEQNPQTMCIDVEPACGKGTGVKCLGRADLEEKPAVVKKKPVRKRTTTRARSSKYRTARR
jgi:hypothetical protein